MLTNTCYAARLCSNSLNAIENFKVSTRNIGSSAFRNFEATQMINALHSWEMKTKEKNINQVEERFLSLQSAQIKVQKLLTHQ